MPPETTAARQAETGEAFDWRPGAIAGVVAGVVMGAMLTMQMTPVIAKAIPGMYGLTGLAAGWVVHLFHATVLGVVFTYLVDAAGWQERAERYGGGVGLGAGYGVVLWVVLAVLVMPLWLAAVGFPKAPSFPNVNPLSFVGHLVYGVVLGGVYAGLEN